MNRFQKRLQFLFALLLIIGAGLGCSTTEPENMSERPWNAPKNWEHGIPTGLTNPH